MNLLKGAVKRLFLFNRGVGMSVIQRTVCCCCAGHVVSLLQHYYCVVAAL